MKRALPLRFFAGVSSPIDSVRTALWRNDGATSVDDPDPRFRGHICGARSVHASDCPPRPSRMPSYL